MQAGFGINEHLIGPSLILLRQPILDKRFVMKGASTGTSIASKTLSRAIPQTFTKTLGKEVGTKVATTVGTNVIGRALGRFVPWVGWGITIHDAWTNRAAIWQFTVDFHNSGQEFYAEKPTYFPR